MDRRLNAYGKERASHSHKFNGLMTLVTPFTMCQTLYNLMGEEVAAATFRVFESQQQQLVCVTW